jgi:hypothetical protein
MPRVPTRVEDQIADPWDYFVPPPSKGTGVPIAARVEPEVKHMISKIVQSGRTKFDTENDLLRAAVSWFIYDKFKKFHDAKFDEGVETMMLQIQMAQHQARVLDLEKFKNVNCDALTKMWALGAEDDTLGWYELMLEKANKVHPRFGRAVRQWAESDPRLTEIHRASIRAGKELAEMEEDEERRQGDRRLKVVKGSKGKRAK